MTESRPLRMVSLESPYHSLDPAILRRNIAYAIQASKHALSMGDVPYPSHLIFTQLVHADGSTGYVHDGVEDKFCGRRQEVIDATCEARRRCDAVVLYTDFGISSGMQYAAEYAHEHGIPVERRTLPEDYLAPCLAQHSVLQ